MGIIYKIGDKIEVCNYNHCDVTTNRSYIVMAYVAGGTNLWPYHAYVTITDNVGDSHDINCSNVKHITFKPLKDSETFKHPFI